MTRCSPRLQLLLREMRIQRTWLVKVWTLRSIQTHCNLAGTSQHTPFSRQSLRSCRRYGLVIQHVGCFRQAAIAGLLLGATYFQMSLRLAGVIRHNCCNSTDFTLWHKEQIPCSFWLKQTLSALFASSSLHATWPTWPVAWAWCLQCIAHLECRPDGRVDKDVDFKKHFWDGEQHTTIKGSEKGVCSNVQTSSFELKQILLELNVLGEHVADHNGILQQIPNYLCFTTFELQALQGLLAWREGYTSFRRERAAGAISNLQNIIFCCFEIHQDITTRALLSLPRLHLCLFSMLCIANSSWRWHSTTGSHRCTSLASSGLSFTICRIFVFSFFFHRGLAEYY